MKKLVLLSILFGLSTIWSQVSIIGDFTNWNQDVNMQSVDNINWTLNYTFSASTGLKFRLDASWDTNWGSTNFPGGTGVLNGQNIPVPAGVYNISFNSQNGFYFFELVEAIIEPFINPKNRQVVLQGFWWDFHNSNYTNGWSNYLAELAPRLKEIGIDAVWIPPTVKNTGTNSVGYAPFDHYDLGDKWQKGNVKTRMGDKDELLRMMAVLKANGMDVIQDVIFNHIMGAGSSNGGGGVDPNAMDDGSTQRYKNFRYACYATPAINQNATTYLSLRGRFPKNWQNFYPNPGNPCCTNDINSPFWGPDIAYESNAFGLSSNATYNPPQSNNYMRNEMRRWLIWYKKQTGWDGVRIDAVKHFPNYATEDFLWNLKNDADWASGGDDMFAVGEWVDFNPATLDWWAGEMNNQAGTFDFALRDGLHGVISGNGLYDLGQIPATQQQNRLRTVPFVNNHDTFRPNFDADGNYTTWGNALAPKIEPNDPRLSVIYAIMMSVDGAPQIFFEDLFDIGYNSNRWNHDPKNAAELPMRSDIANIIWCHQNLHFKSGAYLVRWQAPDALVIERQGKALIATTDVWDTWQNLNEVQTSWPDGTVLQDYSNANTNTTTVYGGGKVNIAIPPCNGTAPQGRRGYAIWAPVGITENYAQPIKRITQEWEMADDLGDIHLNSLQQGGQLPENNETCRLVGKIFAQAGEDVNINVFAENQELGITLFIENANCALVNTITHTGTINHIFTPSTSGWYNLKLKNNTNIQAGQRCWVKVNYQAPLIVETAVAKPKCACQTTFAELQEINQSHIAIYPNPTYDVLHIELGGNIKQYNAFSILTLDGRIINTGILNSHYTNNIEVNNLDAGVYILTVTNGMEQEIIRFVKQ